MRDNLPNKIRRYAYGVVNLDSDCGSGAQWIAYMKRSHEEVYFFMVIEFPYSQLK